MKKVLLIAIAIMLGLNCSAQFSLSGRVLNASGPDTLKLNLPFVYGYDPENDVHIVVNKQGFFNASLPVTERKFATLTYKRKAYQLLLSPGKNLALLLNTVDSNINELTGTAAPENRLLQRLNLSQEPFFRKSSNANRYFNLSPEGIQAQVVKPWLAIRDQQLELINKERGITHFFKRLIAQEVKAYALTQLNNYARIDVRMKQRDLVSFMLELYKDVSVKADALPAGPCFYEFADSYIGYMEARAFTNFQEKGSNPKIPLLYYGISIDSANRLVSEKGKMYMNWLAIKNNYDSKVAEAMLAQAIAAKCQEKQLTELRPLMLEFGSHYPNSVFMPGLKNKIQLLDASLTANAYNKDIAIATNYREISSIYQLVNQYKGKVIYLDVWGTWCAPCRYELGFTPRLKQQFEGKDVVFIYLDMDDDSKDGQWREFLKVNNLIGVHLRKSNQDIKRIWEELQPLKDKQGMYPSYFIFDKNGHLVPETAKRPSEGTELYKQIEKYLL